MSSLVTLRALSSIYLRSLVLLIVVGGLSACVSTPDVVTPVREAANSAQWLDESALDAQGSAAVDAGWWFAFDDPVLNRLIESATTDGYDLRKAQLRLREVQALARQTRSVLWPTVNATGSYTWTEQSINSPSGPSSLIEAGFIDRDLEFWGADVGAQWDVDLFGANRFASRSALAQVEASRAAVDAVGLATIAQVALAYVQYTALEQRLTILNDNVSSQLSSLDVLSKRLAIGLESRLNVDRAAGRLAATKAGLPLLLAQRQHTVYQLALLTNLEVNQLHEVLMDATPLPVSAALPSVGVKAELLTRRPDVRVAQFQMYSAGADVGQAKADLMPKVVIAATSGFSSGSTSTLFDSASRALALAPSVSVPVFNRGRLKAAREASYARYDFALAHYKQTVEKAFIDAETQLLNLRAAKDSAESFAQAAQSNRAAADRAQKLYDRGLLSYLELLDAQRQQLSAEDAAAQATASQDAALVQLYVSLGGGWQFDEAGIASTP